jgi:hypothetical protein
MTLQVGFLIVTSCQPTTDAGESSYTQKLVNLLAAGHKERRKWHLKPQTTIKSTGHHQSWVTIGSKQKLNTPSKVSSLINSKHINVLPQWKLVAYKIKSLAQLGRQQPQRDRQPPLGKVKALRSATGGRVWRKGENPLYRSLGWKLGVVSSTKVSRSFRNIYLETYISGSTEPKSVVLSLWGGAWMMRSRPRHLEPLGRSPAKIATRGCIGSLFCRRFGQSTAKPLSYR